MRVRVVVSSLAVFVVWFILWIWFSQTIIPRPFPTPYDGFWSGLAHGVFVVPDFILSLFNHRVAIYQTPNIGGWYNFGFLLGIGAFGGGVLK